MARMRVIRLSSRRFFRSAAASLGQRAGFDLGMTVVAVLLVAVALAGGPVSAERPALPDQPGDQDFAERFSYQ